jgi:hypothetical protein
VRPKNHLIVNVAANANTAAGRLADFRTGTLSDRIWSSIP